MAHLTHKDMAFKIDNATGALTAITGSVNSQSLAGAMSVLEDTAIGDEERTYLPGVAGATVALNGFVDTTTRAIFAPLVGNRTSITKTVEFQIGTSMYLNGEAYPTDVEISGAPDSLETWSCNLTFSGAVNSTSVAL